MSHNTIPEGVHFVLTRMTQSRLALLHPV